MEAARAAMRASESAPQGERAWPPRGRSTITADELEEWRCVPGNEGVRAPRRADTAARPATVTPVRVCVRLAPVPGIPMLAGETLAVFVDTHDREMAESVAEAVLHARGLTGEVVS